VTDRQNIDRGQNAVRTWDGRWVADRLDVRLQTAPTSPRDLTDLVGLALRRNPKRAHLLVSNVLGKHLPTDPADIHGAGHDLGRVVAEHLDAEPVVLGFAETATALGHLVADELGADYLHSTRRAVPGVAAALGFEEEHSHATGHLLLPEDPGLLHRPRPIVLVDDEISTGRTALNTIAALHRHAPHPHYVVAALVDVRDAADRNRFAGTADTLGVRIDAVSLASGQIALPADLGVRAAAIVGTITEQCPAAGPVLAERFAVPWPHGIRDGGRHGFTAADRAAAAPAADATARALHPALHGTRVHVLGFEELMYAPLLIAHALAEHVPTVRFSTTTRSPVLAVDADGYPIRTRLAFPAHDDPSDGPGERFAYSVAPAAGHEPFSDVVLVLDDAADTPALRAPNGLLAQLGALGSRIHVITLPSYRPAPVGA
jgi:adenine/guanine phosphoribosyltransferase-like PRPP-binding protein